MADVAIIVPVLGRPANAEPLVDSIRAAQTVDTEIWFMCTVGDDEQIAAASVTYASLVVVDQTPAGPGNYARKINAGFKHTDAPYVFTGADDLRFRPGWDTAAIEAIQGYGVCGTNDLGNPMTARGAHSTHSLVTRDYVNGVGATFSDGPGVVYHEGYDHQQVDNELCVAAQERGMWTWIAEPAVEHLHPFWQDKDRKPKAAMDTTYEKALRAGRRDSGIYRQRYRKWSQLRRRGLAQ